MVFTNAIIIECNHCQNKEVYTEKVFVDLDVDEAQSTVGNLDYELQVAFPEWRIDKIDVKCPQCTWGEVE